MILLALMPPRSSSSVPLLLALPDLLIEKMILWIELRARLHFQTCVWQMPVSCTMSISRMCTRRPHAHLLLQT